MELQWTTMTKPFSLLLLLVLSFASGWIGRSFYQPKHGSLADATLPYPVARSCVPPDEAEHRLFDLAATLLELDNNGSSGWLTLGAERFLATGVSRGLGTQAVFVCTPSDIFQRAQSAITAHGLFSKGRLIEYQLQLASNFTQPSPDIVEAVAKVAFDEQPQQSEVFRNQDIRPNARNVLARFGNRTAAYGGIAYAQISAEDAMGTGAAQVAVAAGYPNALERTEKVMQMKLDALRDVAVVPWQAKHRLYELAFAISLSADAAKHLDPIKVLMRKKVESWAPPFGMLPLDPKQVCSVLARIEEENAPSMKEFVYCSDDRVPEDQ
jgi:hypothetical protein